MTLYSAQLCYLTKGEYRYIGTPISVRTKTIEEAYGYARKLLKRKAGDKKHLQVWGPPAPGRNFAEEVLPAPPKPVSK